MMACEVIGPRSLNTCSTFPLNLLFLTMFPLPTGIETGGARAIVDDISTNLTGVSLNRFSIQHSA
jgi:hypothetical protein